MKEGKKCRQRFR